MVGVPAEAMHKQYRPLTLGFSYEKLHGVWHQNTSNNILLMRYLRKRTFKLKSLGLSLGKSKQETN